MSSEKRQIQFTGSIHTRGLQFLLFPGDGIHLLEKNVCSLPRGAVRCRRKYFNAPFSLAISTQKIESQLANPLGFRRDGMGIAIHRGEFV